MGTKDNDPCRDTADKENLIRFTLHAKDITAPATIIDWISRNIESASDDKLLEALKCALDMRRHPLRKMPD